MHYYLMTVIIITMIKSVIFISAIKAIIRFLIAALCVNKLLEHSVLEMIASVRFAFVLQSVAAGRRTALRMYGYPDCQQLLGIKVESDRLQSELKASTL